MQMAATKIVPTNIRSTLASSRVAFSKAKLQDLQFELMKATRRKQIEANIRKEELEQKLEKLKLKEQIETNKKEIEQELKQNEQSKTEMEKQSKQIEENEQCTTELESEPDQPTGKVCKEELKQKILTARITQNILVQTYEERFEKLKLKEQTETNKQEKEPRLKLKEQMETMMKKEIEHVLKRNEQIITEMEQESNQIEENEQSTTELDSEPDQPNGKVVNNYLKQTKPEFAPETKSKEVAFSKKSKRGEMRREKARATLGCTNSGCSKIGIQRCAGCHRSLYCSEVCSQQL